MIKIQKIGMIELKFLIKLQLNHKIGLIKLMENINHQ